MGSKQLVSIAFSVIVIAVVAVVALAAMNGDDTSSSTTDNKTPNSSQSTDTNDETTNGSDNEATVTESVTIEDFKFSPATITVEVGTTVTWTNQDAMQHNVVTDGDNGPDGPLLAQGESYSYTFDEAGTYNYFCQPHPYMKGTVVVTE